MAIWRKNREGSFSPEPTEMTDAPGVDSGTQPVSSVDAVSGPESTEVPEATATTTHQDGPPASPDPEVAEAPQAPTIEPAAEIDGEPSIDTYRPLPRILAVANQKGGVGKTTTTINLGAGLAELGYRVLVVDLDPQGNATTGLGIQRKNFEHSMYDVIMREHPLEDVIEPTSVKNLFVAPATLDLSGVDLRPLKNLSSANLTALKANGAVMYGMNLPAIQLQGAQLQGADLRAAKMVGADLRGANLKNAKLNNSDLRDANLGPLIITADRLLPAQLQGASIRYSDLRGADLLRANFQNADLAYSNLIGTKLRLTDFTETNLDTTLFSKGALHEATNAGCKGLPTD